MLQIHGNVIIKIVFIVPSIVVPVQINTVNIPARV